MRYFLFIDESGDSHLGSQQTEFDVFALCGIVMAESMYTLLDDEMKRLKANYFGGPDIFFHFEEMRSRKGIFRIFENSEILEQFRIDLHGILAQFDYEILAIIVDKALCRRKFPGTNGVYERAFRSLCESCIQILKGKEDVTSLDIMLERRDSGGDRTLKMCYANFLKVGASSVTFPTHSICRKELIFRSKRQNVNGLQLADMCAYPIARKYLSPASPHPIYEIIQSKFYRNKHGKIEGNGLLVLPKTRKRRMLSISALL